MKPLDWLRRLQREDKALAKLQVQTKDGRSDVKSMSMTDVQRALLERRRKALGK